MALDHELPVWGVRPNWSQPIIETLTWLTEVLQSQSGAEQRVALRVAPQRMFEARYNPHEHERTFIDLVMHRLSRNEWMMPLWFDRATTKAPAVAGSSRLELVTEHHEFLAGGMAYLVGDDIFSGEAVQIASVDATGLNLTVPLSAAWSAGAAVHPMRRGWFEESSHVLLTSRLGESNIRFHVIEGNDLTDEGEWSVMHDGTPVLTETPDWSNNIEIDLSFLGDEFDSITGKKRITDTAGRTFRQQQHAFFLHGAAEQFAFRQMLYRLRGQQKGIWLPTFADDVQIAAPANVAAASIDIRQVGLTYIGGPVDGRDRLFFADGQIVPITASALAAGNDRLTLGAGLATAKQIGDRASFIEKARLAQDSVEIEHIGDIDGLARSTLSFRAFADRRVPASASQPIPAAAMVETTCGSPAIQNACTDYVLPPVFTGWHYRTILSMPGNIQVPDGGSVFMRLHNGVVESSGGTFHQNSDGQYIVGGAANQYHVSSNLETVTWYVGVDLGDPRELLIQMQRLGGLPNSAQFQTWNGGGITLITKEASEFINPGSLSTGGAGQTFWPATGGFPSLRYFTV